MRLPNGSSTYHWGIPGTSSVRRTGWPAASSGAHNASMPVTASAGWALRAGRNSSSVPRWTRSAPRSNQQPPRAASSGGLGDPGDAEHPFVEVGGTVLGTRGHRQLHVVQPLHPVPGRHGENLLADRRFSPGVAAQRVVGRHLDQVDAGAVGIVDPGLDQTPRLEDGWAGQRDAPGGQTGHRVVQGPHLEPQGRRPGAPGPDRTPTPR